ncbi:MAG: DNA polymerase III subunit epsilon [Rhizobiales bacterium 24-66-13]|jgi:DNA polymerase-3 subunit epsilon|uniref:DNA polymerase III subunit epsilon n=1 Tax=Roseixanthobacter finlandensis TaxID=3119922 RepID=UPI000BDD52C2|nr:MAG: DNA polymerase III subunit epsilon [Rhizobiales bacterium 35-66-30]OYZ79294.1 MAG: DNA polymerase III subunit epsilon [Rhizobiales bacterium 24-66-13]OZA94294.1 MAG: DNA polymerase III subunit epsilon [Rhizobiales bacterium 39-66-18]HQS08821.1 DNA polymerase III subunit epsilon [Xanthobacteraceae bacterium]HQS45358.1 DNA polymerase III subunit epsilon [Xanthobacteraceae bacterium]
MREIVLDTETTGLDANKDDRLVEIGCVEMVNRILTGTVFHVYINPERDMPTEAFNVHGLSADFLSDKPKFAEVADAFLDFIADDTLVIHNAAFDIGFLNAELTRSGRTVIARDRVIDTLALARRKHPGAQNSLDVLMNRYGIDSSRRVKHGALLDAELLAEVYSELLGGRQAMLVGLVEESGNAAPRLVADTVIAARARPVPLAPRLTQEEHAIHRAFIAQMGDKALWAQYLVDEVRAEEAAQG